MPKIEVYQDVLLNFCGKKMSTEELEDILIVAKAELDEVDEQEGILKIELNDTNRPDLWSTAGLGRQVRIYTTGTVPSYPFFSKPDSFSDTGERTVEVDPALKSIRPYVAAFAVTGKPIDEATLKDLIQTQEKLCWNYGQKRKTIAMGVYRSDLISYPVKFTAADPDKTEFIPLQMEKSLSLRRILSEHPKGQDFGDIVENFPLFPFLTDSNGDVLSFPPIINSSQIGAVEVGDSNLFIEMTGTEIRSLLVAISIVACDLADSGYTILPVKTVYPYDTEFGREITAPYYFQKPVSVEINAANKLLGEQLTVEEAAEYAGKMGLSASVEEDSIQIRVPEYRNDFLHQVDVIEDIMIGRGMNTFQPIMPSEFTPGRLCIEEEFARKVKDLMIGLEYQEMVFNYLGSRRDFIDRMCISGDDVVQIANPMTENYEFVRNSILPNLLSSEAVSAHAVYPHKIFEIGKVSFKDPEDNHGSVTRNYLGFFLADREAGFNEASAQITALFFFLSRSYTLKESEDPRYIPGRSGDIIYLDKKIGVFGEIHPQVLENWGIQMPCTACEIDLDYLIS